MPTKKRKTKVKAAKLLACGNASERKRASKAMNARKKRKKRTAKKS